MYSVSMATCNYACSLESRYLVRLHVHPTATEGGSGGGSGHDERVNKPRREEI